MSGHMGGVFAEISWVQGSQYPPRVKMSDITSPPPSQSFVFLGEHEKTIDDSFFAIPVYAANHWQNSASYWHNGGGTFGFADGHSETKQVIFKGDDKKTMAVKKNWLGPRATVPFGRR